MILRKPALALVALAIAIGVLARSQESGLAKSEPDSATFWLTYEQPAEVYLGKGGVFMSNPTITDRRSSLASSPTKPTPTKT